MGMPLLEAFELLAQSKQLAQRLDAAAAELGRYPQLRNEQGWLETARRRLARAREGIGDLPVRALRLEELASMRMERSREVQGEAVDALERLQAGIGFAGGPRSPLIEMLFVNTKPALLRRVDRDEFEGFCRSFEKRLDSSYAKRMFANETYVVVEPARQNVLEAFDAWRRSFDYPTLDDAAARALSEELVGATRRLDLPLRQARLLAQAALLPSKELLEEYDLVPKPRRRGVPDPDSHAILEHDPPDPDAPTAEERAELEDDASAEGAAAPGATAPPQTDLDARPKRATSRRVKA